MKGFISLRGHEVGKNVNIHTKYLPFVNYKAIKTFFQDSLSPFLIPWRSDLLVGLERPLSNHSKKSSILAIVLEIQRNVYVK